MLKNQLRMDISVWGGGFFDDRNGEGFVIR
jgi:hypothetical protein